jgi:endoglucanase
MYGLHITASGFSGYGSGLGADFKAGKKPYDASKYSGVRFWARVGEGKNTRHRLQLVDATTDKLGGKCNPAADAAEGEKCDDHFGKNLVLTTSWTLYSVPFAELSQIGWGLAGDALDKATLYGLQLTAKPKLNVDLWLDQIEFF